MLCSPWSSAHTREYACAAALVTKMSPKTVPRDAPTSGMRQAAEVPRDGQYTGDGSPRDGTSVRGAAGSRSAMHVEYTRHPPSTTNDASF
jgi:hypothetical protein